MVPATTPVKKEAVCTQEKRPGFADWGTDAPAQEPFKDALLAWIPYRKLEVTHRTQEHPHSPYNSNSKNSFEFAASSLSRNHIRRHVCQHLIDAPCRQFGQSSRTRCGVWRSAVDELAHAQQASRKLHVETWAGRTQGPDLRISREVEIVPGSAVMVVCPSCPDNSPESPGPGSVIRNMLGSSQMEKTVVGGMVVPGCFKKGYFLPSLQRETGFKRGRTAQRGRSPVVPRVLFVCVRARPSYRAAYW